MLSPCINQHLAKLLLNIAKRQIKPNLKPLLIYPVTLAGFHPGYRWFDIYDPFQAGKAADLYTILLPAWQAIPLGQGV